MCRCRGRKSRIEMRGMELRPDGRRKLERALMARQFMKTQISAGSSNRLSRSLELSLEDTTWNRTPWDKIRFAENNLLQNELLREMSPMNTKHQLVTRKWLGTPRKVSKNQNLDRMFLLLHCPENESAISFLGGRERFLTTLARSKLRQRQALAFIFEAVFTNSPSPPAMKIYQPYNHQEKTWKGLSKEQEGGCSGSLYIPRMKASKSADR